MSIAQVLGATNSKQEEQCGSSCTAPEISITVNGDVSAPDTEELRRMLDDCEGHSTLSRGHTTGSTVIDTAVLARKRRNEKRAELEEAESTLQLAMDAVRAELGDGFVLSEADESKPDEDMNDSANWRKGDVLTCVTKEVYGLTPGKGYAVLGKDCDGDPIVQHDDGDRDAQFAEDFRFHHRP